MREHTTLDTEVVVIGGGPVGLSASLLLAQQGVRSILLEKNATITNHPKASAFNTRTMEILRQLDVADDIYAGTGPVGGVSFYTSLTGYKLGEIAMADFPDYLTALIAATPAPITISSQIELERVLKTHADDNPLVDVRFCCEKLALTQHQDYVEIQTRDLTSGTATSIKAHYAIACDGAGSPTRRECDRRLIGPPAFGHQINVYIEADIESLLGEARHQALYWIAHPEASGVFIGLGGDWKKWCFNFSYFPDRGERFEDFTAEVCLGKVHAALGTTALPVKILSIGPWVLCGQVIDQFRDGRVFFGGDAAHLNIPTGGFGFNTGMQEIHNLAWKLGYVLRDRAPDALLDSYHAERRDIAVFNVETSRQNAINIRETGAGLGAEIVDADEIERDTKKGARQRRQRSDAIARQKRHFIFLGQEIGFGYWDSPLVTPDGSPHYVDEHAVEDPIYTYVPNARPGARAPHCWITRAAEPEQRMSLLDLFTTYFTLLLHGDIDGWQTALDEVSDDIPLQVLSIGAADSGADLIDCDATWNWCYGIDDAGAVLVRPDGHVAWRAACRADQHQGDAVTTALRRSLARDIRQSGG